MVDPDSLENCCVGNCTVGSNPTPSAIDPMMGGAQRVTGFHLGAVAQLGERRSRSPEVVGSNPICSTKNLVGEMTEPG